MDRAAALEQAQLIAQQQQLSPTDADFTAFFQTDYLTQFFVELDAGGKEAFQQMIEDNLYQPYTWRVRRYKEHEPAESLVVFTSDGKPYGFAQTYSENTPGAQLNAEDARAIAEKNVARWNINLDQYKLIESGKETVPSGRVDHTFTYERPDIKIGEGFYRLRLRVSGDVFSELTQFVQVPENFIRKYTQMRSANDAIAYYAKIALILLYFLGGCILGLLFLLRRHFVLWKMPIVWGIIFILLSIAQGFNNIPLAWTQYNTALSSNGYIAHYIISIFLSASAFGIFFTMVFAASESLTRYAFGNHLQFWKVWSKGVANSIGIIGRTIGSYLLVPIFLAFAILVYLFMNRYFGWWSPASALFDPNILATYLPWLNPLAISLQAGFWEECMFRAVPLSCAAILGEKYGRRNWWIGAALILQAVIFGAAHANYPAQPAIARVIELFIPSLMFGSIYLAFGLLTSVITHFLYDTLLFSIPLLVATGHHACLYRFIVLIGALIPVWIIAIRRFQAGKWDELPAWAFNRSWRPTQKEQSEQIPISQKVVSPFSRWFTAALLGLGVMSLAVWYWAVPHTQQVEPLWISQKEAVTSGEKTFAQLGIDHTKPWNTYPVAYTNFECNNSLRYINKFVWQMGGKEGYEKLLGTYVQGPAWQIRFVQFEGPLIDRAEEVTLTINNKNEVIRVIHTLPESLAGAHLSEADARKLVHRVLQERFNINPEDVTEISALPTKRPERIDWAFTFRDEKNYPLQAGQARINITLAGDEVTDYGRFVQVPEEWSRAENQQENKRSIINLISMALIYLIICIGCLLAALKWTHHIPLGITFLAFFAFIFLIELGSIFNTYNTIIVSNFNTSQPFQDQWIRIFGSLFLKAFFLSALYALLISFIQRISLPTRIQRSLSNGLIGFCIGIIFAALQTVLAFTAPSLEPLWARYDSLNAWSPVVQGVSNSIILFFSLSIFFVLLFTVIDWITEHASKKIVPAFFLLQAIGFALSGVMFADNLLLYISFGMSFGLLSFISYYQFFRFDFAPIPLALAGYLITTAAQQLFYNAFPAVFSIFIISTICILIIAFAWFKKLNYQSSKEVI